MSAQPVGNNAVSPLRILPIPEHAVPAVPIDEGDPGAPDERQLTIRLDLVPPSGTVRRSRRQPIAPGASAVRSRPADRRLDEDEETGQGPLERPTGLVELQHWVTKLVPAMLEAAAGTRPAPQLMRWVSAPVYEALVRRHTRAVRRGSAVRRPLRVVRVVLREPAVAIVEASVVFTDGQRVRAAALRFIPVDHRWVVDAFEVG